MDKKNWVILAVIVLAAVVLFIAGSGMKTETSDDVVIISVDGQEYKRVPLSSPQTVTVEQEDGAINVIEISDHGAVMLSSTCHNQKCVKMGEVNTENWETRVNGAFIICLPNRVTIELAVKE